MGWKKISNKKIKTGIVDSNGKMIYVGSMINYPKRIRVSGNAWVYGNARVSGNAEVSGDARVSLKRAYTKGNFIHSSDNTIETTVIDQSNEDGFDNGIDYANLLVVGDYEISKIDEPAKPTETIQIEGKSYTLDEIKKALEKGK